MENDFYNRSFITQELYYKMHFSNDFLLKSIAGHVYNE